MKYFLSGYQLLYAIPSSLSKAKKKPKMVRKMTMLLVKTSPHDAHVIWNKIISFKVSFNKVVKAYSWSADWSSGQDNGQGKG